MRKNPVNDGIISEKSAGIGPVTQKRVRQRAHELALIAGRSKASPLDYDQAKKELKGDASPDLQEKTIEAMPESKRWDPIPGSPGRKAPEVSNEDEDDEGRSEDEQLVEEGVNEAAHEQMLEAAREAAKKIRRQ